jgi:hypothetical protein
MCEETSILTGVFFPRPQMIDFERRFPSVHACCVVVLAETLCRRLRDGMQHGGQPGGSDYLNPDKSGRATAR